MHACMHPYIHWLRFCNHVTIDTYIASAKAHLDGGLVADHVRHNGRIQRELCGVFRAAHLSRTDVHPTAVQGIISMCGCMSGCMCVW